MSLGTCIPTLDRPVTGGTLPTSKIRTSGGILTLKLFDVLRELTVDRRSVANIQQYPEVR